MKFKNYCTQRKICLPSDTMRGNEADCFITSLVAPGLPIAPLKYTLMKFKIYSMQWKIFVHIDKTISKRSTLLHHNFAYCKFNNSTNKYMTNEISKLLNAMKNLHSDETSAQETDFVPFQV